MFSPSREAKKASGPFPGAEGRSLNLPQFFGPKVSQPAQIITSGSAGRNAELGIPDADRARPQPADDPRGVPILDVTPDLPLEVGEGLECN